MENFLTGVEFRGHHTQSDSSGTHDGWLRHGADLPEAGRQDGGTGRPGGVSDPISGGSSSMISWEACSMSRSHARSRNRDGLGVVKDLLPANPVWSCFDESPLDQIDGMTAQGLQLLAHGQPILDLPVAS